MGRERAAVPAGKQVLCRRDILGVPGVLDGLSHVVSVGRKRKKKLTLVEEQQQQHPTISVILSGVVKLFITICFMHWAYFIS